MRFFTRKSKAIKNWHSRAMVIDLSKTTVTFINTEELDDHIPPWMHKKSSLSHGFSQGRDNQNPTCSNQRDGKTPFFNP